MSSLKKTLAMISLVGITSAFIHQPKIVLDAISKKIINKNTYSQLEQQFITLSLDFGQNGV